MSPTPFDPIFLALEGALHVPVLLGAVSAAASSNERRIVFERGGAPKYGPIPYRVPGEKTIGRLAHPFKVAICGASDTEVTELLGALIGALDELVGPPQGCAVDGHEGYSVTPGQIVGDDLAAAGFVQEASVTLHTRVRSQIRATAEITSTTITATAQATADTSEASLEGSAGT